MVLPVLATPVNGVRELIEDSANGYLITREPEMIAERLRRLGADPAERTRLGTAARASALAFGWDEMVARHEALYASIVSLTPAGDATGEVG